MTTIKQSLVLVPGICVFFSIVAVQSMAVAPVAKNDTVTTYKDHRIVCNVLLNDLDADGDTLSLSSITQPAHGTVGISTKEADTTLSTALDGFVAVVYRPRAGYLGSDQFNYTCKDGKGGTSTSTCNITVLDGRPIPPNPNPTALGANSLDILFIGDSNIESQNMMGGIMHEFERRFGYFGTGYRSFVYYTQSNPSNVLAAGGNGWERDMSNRYMQIAIGSGFTQNYWKNSNLDYSSPSMMSISATTTNATASVDFYGTMIIVYYLSGSGGGGTIGKTIDGTSAGSIVTGLNAPTAAVVRADTTKGLTRGWHKLVVTTTAMTGTVTLVGVDARNYEGAGPIALCHDWGLSAITTINVAQIQDQIYQSALQLLNPTFVHVAVGVNDFNSSANGYAATFRDGDVIIKKIRVALSNTKISISSAPAFGCGFSQTLVQRTFNHAYPVAAAGWGAAYFNLFDTMGGQVSPYKYNYKGGSIHISPEGGEVLGSKWYTFFANHPATPPPTNITIITEAPQTGKPAMSKASLWIYGDGAMKVDQSNGVAEWSSSIASVDENYPRGLIGVLSTHRPTRVVNGLGAKPTIKFDGTSSLLCFLNGANRNDRDYARMIGVMKVNRVGDPLLSNGWCLTNYGAYAFTNAVTIGFQIIDQTISSTISGAAVFGQDQKIKPDWYAQPNVQQNTETWFSGEIAEMVLFDQAPSAADTTVLKNYLRTKWFTTSTIKPVDAVVKIDGCQTLRIFAMNGKCLGAYTVNNNVGPTSLIKILSKGVYVVSSRIEHNGVVTTRRIVVPN